MKDINNSIKKAEERRADYIEEADALLEKEELTNEDLDKVKDLQEKAEKETEYINAKKWQEQQTAKNAEPYEPTKDEKKELERFSMSKFLMSVDPQMSKHLSEEDRKFYQDLHQKGIEDSKAAGITTGNIEGTVLPRNILVAKKNQFRNDLTIGTEGADITFDMDGGFIDSLKDRLVLTSLGTDFLDGLTGDVKFPRESNNLSATWEGETDANAEETPTYDNVSLSPKRLGFFVDVSRQSLLQTNPAIDARIERNMVNAVRRALETAAINGSGSAPIPEGILNTTGIGSNDVGTNGGAQTWDHWVDNETSVAADNADMGSLAYLTNAKVRGQAKTTIVDSGSGRFIWPVNATEVNGYPVGVSNLVPDDLTKGTGTALSALIFGNFNDLVIGQWGGLEVLVDPFTQATSGIVRMVINMYADVAVLHPESFSATQDIDTTA